MTDRELLELAARAAGIEVVRSRLDDPMNSDFLIVGSVRNHEQRNGPWNPLEDDGDALRLAVKLGMDFRIVLQTNFDATVLDATHVGVDRPLRAWRELHGADPFAATRLAITRAAAEIGRTMP